MARSLASKPNVVAPAGAYPYGRVKDNTGANDGTPVNELVYGDFHQFFERMIWQSGLAPNDLPENSINGFQYFDALQALIAYKEPWILVGAGNPTPFGTDWNNYSGIAPTKYRKTKQGEVVITGVVSNGATNTNPVFTLPVGYRPTHELKFSCTSLAGTNAVYTVTVGTNGNITLDNPQVTSVLYLNNIRFFVD